MKRILIFGMILCIILTLSGCESVEVDRIFHPAGADAELYYDTYDEVRNRIKREDVKRNTYYNDLFLADGIKSGMSVSEVLYAESREALLDISTATDVFFIGKATGGTKLTEWINQSTIKYTFDQNGIVSKYEIVNSKSNNTYIEYLYVMRALSLKYGECTTEIYKNEDNIINNTKIKEDYKETEAIIDFFEQEFANENIGIISQWVNDDGIITVDFTSPEACSVVYELIDSESSETDEE